MPAHSEDDPHITFAPQGGEPGDGYMCLRKRWWITHPTRGIVLWKGGPQCNTHRSIPERLLSLYPWAEVQYFDIAFIPPEPNVEHMRYD